MKITPKNVKSGMGATRHFGSDCYPFTVVKVNKSGKTIVVQEDSYRPSETMKAHGKGIFGTQDYVYERNPEGDKMTFTWRKNGTYQLKGIPTRSYGCCLHVGTRRYYYDPHF